MLFVIIIFADNLVASDFRLISLLWIFWVNFVHFSKNEIVYSYICGIWEPGVNNAKN